MNQYTDYIIEQAKNLLSIDSPSGYTKEVVEYLIKEYESLGYSPTKTTKGSVLVDLGGEGEGVFLTAHVDTLGAMVAEMKSNGGLRIDPIGWLSPNNVETENCRIYTFDGKTYTGTFQLNNASLHVNKKFDEISRSFDDMEIILDEIVSTKEQALSLGIMNGNYIGFDPRTIITSSGYIKSRFLDDKLSTAILLGYAKYLKDENVSLTRKIYNHITVFEEVGHGGAASIPLDVTEILSVDMGCVGEGLECTEHKVSICTKDSRSPYHYDTVKGLISAAKENNIDYATDVYPYYSSDTDAALSAGYDIRHGLIGPGVYASHGYERSHIDGVKNTLLLLKSYIC